MSFPFFELLLEKERSTDLLILFKSSLEKELFMLTSFYYENRKRFKLYTTKEIRRIYFYFFRIKKAYSLGVNEAKSIRFFRSLFISDFYIACPYSYDLSCEEKILKNENKIHKTILYLNLLFVPDKEFFRPVEYKDYFIGQDVKGVVIKENDYIVFSSGSGEIEKHKRWPVDKYRRLVRKIIDETNYNVIFVGSQSEQKIVDDILNNFENKHLNRITQLNGETSLYELINILRGSALVVGNDNGVIHIASACDSKVLSVFGSTNYKITGPVGNYIDIVDNAVHCAPCYADLGIITGCEDNICMKSITAEQVYEKVKGILVF